LNCVLPKSFYDNKAPLLLASYAGNLTITEMLLRKGANVTTKDGYGATALHYACISGNKKVVKLLVKYQASTKETLNSLRIMFNHKLCFYAHETPLQTATNTLKYLTNADSRKPIYTKIVAFLSSKVRITALRNSLKNEVISNRLSDYFTKHPKYSSIDCILLLRRESKPHFDCVYY